MAPNMTTATAVDLNDRSFKNYQMQCSHNADHLRPRDLCEIQPNSKNRFALFTNTDGVAFPLRRLSRLRPLHVVRAIGDLPLPIMLRRILQHPAEFEFIRGIKHARRLDIDLFASAQDANIP